MQQQMLSEEDGPEDHETEKWLQDMDGDGSDEVPPQSGWLSQQQSLACSRLNI